MIDEKKLIEKRTYYPSPVSDYEAGWNDCNKDWMGRIWEQPQVGGWIPVSKRLPENCKEVLVQWEKTNRAENITTVYLSIGLVDDDGEWCSSDGFGIFNGKVIAWQPLPEPFKESEGK